MKRLGGVETAKDRPKVAPATRWIRINPGKSLTLLKNVLKGKSRYPGEQFGVVCVFEIQWFKAKSHLQ